MADNFDFTAGSGTTGAADEIGGVKYARVKITMGADGAADMDLDSGQQTMANSMPVAIASNQSALSVDLGANNDVTVTSGAITETNSGAIKTAVELLDNAVDGNYLNVNSNIAGTDIIGGAGAVAAGVQRVTLASDDPAVVDLAAIEALLITIDSDTNTIQTDTTSIDGKITACDTGAVVLATGAAAIGKLAANTGVDIGDVDVTSIISGVGATNLGKAEDAAHSTGDVGVMALAVENEDQADLSTGDKDYTPIAVTKEGNVIVKQEGTITVTESSPLSGFATSALQLADGHNVTIDNISSNEVFVRGSQSAGSPVDGEVVTVQGIAGADAVTVGGTVALTNTSVIGAGDPTVDSYTTATLSEAADTANQEIIAAPGASKQIWVMGIQFSVGTGDGSVSFQDEDDTAISGVMPFAENGGMAPAPTGNFAMPLWKVATNKSLEVDTVTCDIKGSIQYAIVSV